ncbi:HTH domain-containing protein [Halosolutus gelatinilyticus]|uniref:HTH domain-containing protein n=1 Tax=Halosolutus gelatinilyticus TaxID=2931975 RepID=UPI001FF133AE|nr:HTH domain-containing protein [Halosolutus gelatinilyticus]
MSPQSSDVTVVCHVRAPLLFEPIDSQVETLRACEMEGAVDDLLLRSWPKEVALDGTPHQEVLETYERFAEWADRRGVRIEPPFRKRTTTSQVTGETTELLVTPLLCLELYADDELVGVFPHSLGEETYTTDDAIAKLRTGELPRPLAPERPIEATDSDGCPDCGGSLVDGQGLFACGDCGWVGTLTEAGTYAPHPQGSKRDEVRRRLPVEGERAGPR